MAESNRLDKQMTSPEKVKEFNTVTRRQAEKARRHINVGQIVARLNRCVEGTAKMDTTQIRAAQILLDRTMPTLQSIETTSNDVQDLSAFLMQAADIAKQLQQTAEGQEKLDAARKAAKPKKPSDDVILRGKPGETPPKPAESVKTLN